MKKLVTGIVSIASVLLGGAGRRVDLSTPFADAILPNILVARVTLRSCHARAR